MEDIIRKITSLINKHQQLFWSCVAFATVFTLILIERASRDEGKKVSSEWRAISLTGMLASGIVVLVSLYQMMFRPDQSLVSQIKNLGRGVF